MPPPSSLNGAWASVTYHVQQWINLVLYNSIYQNLILLYFYRLFKFIYGFLDRSTELSRICGANDWVTPLDPLWDQDGHVTSSLVLEKHLGTIVFATLSSSSSSFPAHVHLRATSVVNGGARRGSNGSGTSGGDSAGTRSSQESIGRSSIALDQRTLASSGGSSTTTAVEELEPSHEDLNVDNTILTTTAVGGTTELKHRKKRSVSSASNQSTTSSNAGGNGNGTNMDLRQARSAAGMIYRIDRCILFSKQLILERRELEQADSDPVQITQQILRKKRFPEGGSPNTLAAKKLQYAMDKIALTHQLAREINQRANTKYDSTNPAHERKLHLLWELLCPHEKLEGRYTKQWTDIGFQGKDPATDFRGMGMLGLDDLVYYAQHYTISSRHALECSHDAFSWYSYAIVGINITAFAVQTLRTRQLQYYLFLNGTDRSVYHELYCYLFHRFNGYWTSLDPKPSVMDFERVFGDFKFIMERQLTRRKLMMLRFDTKETLGSGGFPITQPVLQKSAEKGETIELEARKSK